MTPKERQEAYQTQDPELCLESPMERLVYNALKTEGIAPIMQYPFGKYWIDFALPKYKIAIEYDGECHEEKINHDKIRDKYIRSKGWEIVHFHKDYLYRINEENEYGENPMQLEDFISWLRGFIRVLKEGGYKYTCPECLRDHSEEHHPPYCQDCILSSTM